MPYGPGSPAEPALPRRSGANTSTSVPSAPATRAHAIPLPVMPCTRTTTGEPGDSAGQWRVERSPPRTGTVSCSGTRKSLTSSPCTPAGPAAADGLLRGPPRAREWWGAGGPPSVRVAQQVPAEVRHGERDLPALGGV